MQRCAGVLVPDHGSLTLVGDSDGFDGYRAMELASRANSFGDCLLDTAPDGHRVLFYPPVGGIGVGSGKRLEIIESNKL